MRSTKRISVDAAAVALLLVIGAVLGAVLMTEGPRTIVRPSERMIVTDGQNESGVHTYSSFIGSGNGTSYIQIRKSIWDINFTLDYHFTTLVAFDEEGNEKWRMNSSDYAFTSVNSEGTIYGIRVHDNITTLLAVGSDGYTRRTYGGLNGSCWINGFFSDDSVLVTVKQKVGEFETNLEPTLLCLSKDLEPLWTYEGIKNLYDWPYSYPIISTDDKVIVFDVNNYNLSDISEIILDSDGQLVKRVDHLNEIPIASAISGWNCFHLETVLSEDKNRSDIRVISHDLFDGHMRWNTTLATSWSPDKNTPWALGFIFVDGKGTLYTIAVTQGLEYMMYALDQEGNVLWSRPMDRRIAGTFQDGGALVESFGTYTKVNSDGSIAWSYEPAFEEYYNAWALVRDDGKVLLACGGKVILLTEERDTTVTGLLIADLVLMASLAIGYVAWSRRKK